MPKSRQGKKKRKKEVDPNAPKRPSSAYMLYMREARPAIIKKYNFDKSDIASVGKELGRSWKKLKPKLRRPYEKRAQEEYSQYRKEKTAYDVSRGIDPEKVSKKKSRTGDVGRPGGRPKKKIGRPRKTAEAVSSTLKRKKSKKKRKRDALEARKPMTSYLCFCKVARPHLMVHFSGDTFANMGKKLGAAWKSLAMEDKYPFYAAAEADRLRYLRECRAMSQEPMYSPSLAGLSAERWQAIANAKDITLFPAKPSLY